jgi:hypothetical protein
MVLARVAAEMFMPGRHAAELHFTPEARLSVVRRAKEFCLCCNFLPFLRVALETNLAFL